MTDIGKQRVKVVITSGGTLLGQGILRALKRSSLNVHAVALDPSPLSAGLYWADESYLVPPASSSEFLESIRRLLTTVRPDIVLVGTEVELAPLALERTNLEREFGTRILVSASKVVALADDKYETALFFRNSGFAAPESAPTGDPKAVDALVASHGFPLMVKPRSGARSRGVVKVSNPDELQAAVSRTQYGVVQEFVVTDDHEYTASGLYFDGRCDAAIVMRRELRDGNTYRAYTVTDSRLSEQVRAWTDTLKPYGPANFQFGIDKNGIAKVFEINARFSGTTPLRARAGFNEVEMCIRKLMWNEPIVQPSIRPVTILRHWSETVIEPAQVDSVTKL